MEMHQVRYFLAVAQHFNFTRAAEECNVTQPSLTRAIKQLEAELGGDLFRRERPAAQLTELGQRMHPLLKQCYEAAAGARSLASSFKSGEIGALRIALTHSIDLALLIPHLDQLKRQFNRLEFRFLRGTGREVGELLKKGEAELGIAAEIDEAWERLDVPTSGWRWCRTPRLSRQASNAQPLPDWTPAAPSICMALRGASAPQSPPPSCECCAAPTGGRSRDSSADFAARRARSAESQCSRLALSSALSKSSISMRLRKSGSTKRAFTRPSRPTMNTAGIGNIQPSLP
jgi:DNA-binding transcriptional LysR family regulator